MIGEELEAQLSSGAPVLVVGFGLHGQAVSQALTRRNVSVVVVDDRPSEAAQAIAAEQGVDIIVAPDRERLAELVDAAALFCPTPGLPESHVVFELAQAKALPVVGEFDLAGHWDDRTIVAITGTNGKTTVTTLVMLMLRASNVRAVEAGNTDVALVSAIDDSEIQVFVVEASSFRLGHSSTFRPAVGTWLNFDPDHLDVHATLQDYEDAKASIWAHQTEADVAVANAEDAVVMGRLTGEAQAITFGLDSGDNRLIDGQLVVNGEPILAAGDMFRSLPHDITNALAAATTALAAGATVAGVQETLRTFEGLAHRVEFVGEANELRWYDDSKATTPHAVVAAVGGFDSVVLLAGGKNKGIDLGSMAQVTDRLRAVVAIGAAADEVIEVFSGSVPVERAASMEEAVDKAAGLGEPGDVILLSPGCASYDWYKNYGERGDHFTALARERHLKDAS